MSNLLKVVMLLMIVFLSEEAKAKPQFTAMFVFGDSLIDPGNNVYFRDSRAKGNYLPYGIDYPLGPTGRFSNGKIITDLLGEMLGIPLIPSYADTIVRRAAVSLGVNYASAGAGVLEDTGLGRVIPLRKQIENFKNTLKQLVNQMQGEKLSNYLAKALVVDELGSNDIGEYYGLDDRSARYSPREFVDLVINQYMEHILEQHRLGLRKFLIMEIQPFGCLPQVKSIKQQPPPGKCVKEANNLVQIFNSRLRTLVSRLNLDYPGSVFVLGGFYQLFYELYNNAESYGFKVKDSSCCRTYLNTPSTVKCKKNSVPCSNRDEYFFWDSSHPTQAVSDILVHCLYENASYTFPMSIQKLAKM